LSDLRGVTGEIDGQRVRPRRDGRYAKLLRTLARVDVLILDDWLH
jgi:DNA replication protein DnaC